MIIKTLPNLETAIRLPNLGKKVRRAREDCGLSQAELAKAVGFETSVPISLMEAEKRTIGALRLYRIAHVTNKPIQWFYTNSQAAGEGK